MTNYLHYVIVRFRPFPETGEFANVGIVLFEKSAGLVAFKLTPKRFKRVSQFFSDMPVHLFAKAIAHLDDELSKLLYQSFEEGNSAQALEHLLRTKESIFQFSEPRSVRVPGQNAELITDLYNRYIGRSFISQEYREDIIARDIRQVLKQRRIVGFRSYQINDELMPIRFPLASTWNGLHIIKPIAFDQKSTVAMMDHAATWRDRFKYLMLKGQLRQEKILIPIEHPPHDSDSAVTEAFFYARKKLEDTGVKLIDHQNVAAIVAFAANAAHPSPSITY